MGRKGWAGAPPADDREARKRILDAAIASIERRGPRHTTVSDIAADLGVTRSRLARSLRPHRGPRSTRLRTGLASTRVTA